MVETRDGFAENEYGRLLEVLMCSPEQMQIVEPINDTQKRYKKSNIDQKKAVEQHHQMRAVLENHGVRVHLLPPEEKMPEQVFTRDLGFTSTRGILIGKMQEELREPETEQVKQWMGANGWKYEEMETGALEGGDIIIDGSLLFAAESSRTTPDALDELKNWFPEKKLVRIPLKKQYLHLDCVFNILSPATAIIYEQALTKEALGRIKMHYRTISIGGKEQFRLAANVLGIGNHTVMALPENKRVNHQLKEWGFNVIEVEFSEIIKSGGAFRCVTFPLKRMTEV
ncbi:dimethylarginine dimethylaminohydrolase family protein [Salibacterium halotolerans]|uniref:N-Dimethylarginine dimethylaminohydrolase n=1 Tax=Salibacterium halotolerans TaxID=1884432 RepID=A0A1I5T4V6_9BACI|nr:arginine deiminase family protein [Salibacterium halotolerans]SFP78043.1 N-Dimethylarginine dimethylaminohydrolase [Salibacterium halotolerans]